MTNINYSQSKVKSFRRCQKQFAFRHDYAPEGQELVKKVSKRNLWLGTWMHALQEAHHRRWAGVTGKKASWEKVHKKKTKEFNSLFAEEKEMLGATLPDDALRLWQAYLRFWGEVEEKYIVAGLKDGSPAIEFLVEVPLKRYGRGGNFKGRIDLMVEDLEHGGLWIWDAKWVKKIPSDDERMMSPQSLMYPWGLGVMGYDVKGFVYNYGRTKIPTVPQVLKRPAGQLSTAQRMDTDYYTYLQAIKQAHGERWKVYAKTVYRDKLLSLQGRDALWFRRERIPIDKVRVEQALAEFLVTVKQVEKRPKPEVAPRTYLFSCNYPNAGCAYHELCVAEFNGLNIEPLIRANYEYVGERYGDDPDAIEEEEDLLRG